MTVEVSGDIAAVVKLDRHIPFGAARATTKTAQQSQAASINAMLRTFTIRGMWPQPSSRFGVRITPATVGRLEATVKTGADWLIPHETGEDKVAQGGGLLAIPIVGPGRPRPSRGAKVRRELKPRALGSRGVVIKTRRGPVLFAREGRRLVAFYGLERRARITRRSTVIEPTVRTVEKNFGTNFAAGLTEALRTAK
jgi:hypothetical protein